MLLLDIGRGSGRQERPQISEEYGTIWQGEVILDFIFGMFFWVLLASRAIVQGSEWIAKGLKSVLEGWGRHRQGFAKSLRRIEKDGKRVVY